SAPLSAAPPGPSGPGSLRGGIPASRPLTSGERLAAAAGALRVRVVDREPGVLETVAIVERSAREVLGAGRVDDHAYPVAVDLLDVVGGLLAVEEHLVREPRAPTRAHGHAETELRLVLGVEELLDLGRRGFGENDHLGP